jgi:hypothetical protein
VLPAERDPRSVPPLTVSPVVVALPRDVAPAERDPRSVPPWTVNPVVVALAAVVAPKVVPLIVPPVMATELAACPAIVPRSLMRDIPIEEEATKVFPSELETMMLFPEKAFVKESDPRLAPPVTVRDVEVPAPKERDPRDVPP